MSLIILLNTYVINDISSIIYDYYYDLYKIKELKKDLLKEYHRKIIFDDNITYYNKGFGIYIELNNRSYKSKVNYNRIYRFATDDTKYIYNNVAILPKIINNL